MEVCRAIAGRCAAALEVAVLSELPVTLSEDSFATGDLSFELGKDPFKLPRFSRFAKPPKNIQASVMRMRALTQKRQAFRTRSWEAAFSFTRRSLKVPKFERFANPPGNITASVQEMRLAAADKRANRQRSWAASFKFARSSKKPQFERFANPASDIFAAVQEMRLVAAARRAKRQRSWAATFKFAVNSKQPLFKRFASPASNITAAVWDMRLRLSSQRAAAKAKKVQPEDQVLIEDVMEEPEASTSTSTSRDLGMKMLTAPPSEMEQIQERLHNLLMNLEQHANDKHSVDVFLQQAAFPSPIDAAVSLIPAKPIEQASIDSDLEANGSWEPQYEPLAKPPASNEVRAACEGCAKVLRKFRKQVEVYKEEQQAEKLIQQEQQRYSALEEEKHRNVEQLIAEELAMKFDPKLTGKVPPKGAGLVKGSMFCQSAPSLHGSTTKWFAGSSLSAVRQLRRNRVDSETNHFDKSNKSSGFAVNFDDLDVAGKNLAYKGPKLVGCAGAKSAMEMDLGI
eukprot:TRINITY_DN1187_c0_g1_i1.p1 TRINITY_DN1187_c0_g1~~TRINITY_DN1187_c0_g1_i1.p1  ORF type:complete len:540 (+),score=125.10 TRINITY_DN1187_c0_g1_i1:86-1621(+)